MYGLLMDLNEIRSADTYVFAAPPAYRSYDSQETLMNL